MSPDAQAGRMVLNQLVPPALQSTSTGAREAPVGIQVHTDEGNVFSKLVSSRSLDRDHANAAAAYQLTCL